MTTKIHVRASDDAVVTLCGIQRPPGGWAVEKIFMVTMPLTDGASCQECVNAMKAMKK